MVTWHAQMGHAILQAAKTMARQMGSPGKASNDTGTHVPHGQVEVLWEIMHDGEARSLSFPHASTTAAAFLAAMLSSLTDLGGCMGNNNF